VFGWLKNIRIKLIVSVVIIAVVVIMTWWLTSNYKDATWGARLADLEKAQTEAHNAALQAALDKERAARAAADELEVAYNDQIREINKLAVDNERLLADNGGLRDKNASLAADVKRKPAGGSACPAPEPGQLSVATSRKL
jgi:biopolymer transport protein ExbB/TolQ